MYLRPGPAASVKDAIISTTNERKMIDILTVKKFKLHINFNTKASVSIRKYRRNVPMAIAKIFVTRTTRTTSDTYLWKVQLSSLNLSFYTVARDYVNPTFFMIIYNRVY